MEWHDYKHLDWISVRRDDDQIYKFNEGNFKWLRLQDIEDMLLLLVQGKLSNLTIEERRTCTLKKPPTLDRDWNKTLPAVQGSIQTWISELAKQADSRSSFNELLDTPLDFSNFIMNRLRVDTLTPELLAGPTFELMKGSCTSLIELEYHLEEVYKATTDQLDWVNPKGQHYPHNLLQPLPLIPDNRCRRVIPFAHFINNDLEYLRGGASSRKYTTSEPINYDKHALWEVSHWGRKRQQFYGFAINRESALNVYSKRRIIAVTDLKIMEWHSYKHLDWITDVYTKHRHSATYGRSSTGSRKLLEEAQPYEARYVSTVIKPSQPIFLENDNNLRVLPILLLQRLGDENPVRTLGDYSKPSYEGYRNTIELPVENNV
nr:hypothetical protein [Tanacetum cinerariifolium]